jgi:type 2 lantibiotic biosynthesis protein LanM
MDAFYDRLVLRAATIDELLSEDFEALPGQKGDADLAALRLAAWCRSCASGDWSLFDSRLHRDGLTFSQVLARFATVRRLSVAAPPHWMDDAIWIESALQTAAKNPNASEQSDQAQPCAFEELFTPVVEKADALFWTDVDPPASDGLNKSARACLRHSLLKQLSDLFTSVLYEHFDKARKAKAIAVDAMQPQIEAPRSQYDKFVAEMKAGGFRRLFEDKPVLLRLMATVTRQWIDTSRKLVVRLNADLLTIRRDILHASNEAVVVKIEDDLSDRHNGGHSVQIVSFADGSRVVYKPKDLRIDAAWYSLVERLNRLAAPVELQAMPAVARDGYGWTQFIEHAGCADGDGPRRFFRRAGAWLALFHCFAATDIHQENVIAAGDHPVPIDLEMILQATSVEDKSHDPEGQAFEAAMETVLSSVMMVGLLPAFGRSPENKLYAVGGMIPDQSSKTKLVWDDINSDKMRRAKLTEAGNTIPNLPHVDGHYAKFGEHIDDFIAGFEDYANFLLRLTKQAEQGVLFDGFARLPVRKLVRPTRFYAMLLQQRLRDYQAMDDGVLWSAQADFLARMADWQSASDPLWPLQRAERSALVALNVPHFVSSSDGNEICDAAGASVRTAVDSGLDRARARVESFDEREIAWQVEVIRQNTSWASRTGKPLLAAGNRRPLLCLQAAVVPTDEMLIAEADKIAADLARHAIRSGPGAAWIGLDWLGDSDVFQLVPLGPELYNGASGIAVFFAAHSAVTGCKSLGDLALAAVSHLRKDLKNRNTARKSRAMGIGGASGLGSIVYALAVMANCLSNEDLLADALNAAKLFTDDLIAADKTLDVMGGSAGAILGLLRLHRDTGSGEVLRRATDCGEHLLSEPRLGRHGRRSWLGQGMGTRLLNGMSHGAAGFAYALAALATATNREDFAAAAAECIAFEDSSYEQEHKNWPDLRPEGQPEWVCGWCNGAAGIGLARIAITRFGTLDGKLDPKMLATDIRNALDGAEHNWPGTLDTLCCGTFGNIEFFCEAATALGRSDLAELASRRLMAVLQTAAWAGDYRWNVGKTQFNLGLFSGLAGAGYTVLRRADNSLPNILLWE